ncbi:hypothetical protein ACFQPG_04665 [Sphingomonas sp. GCM10030256]|uniref:hypothetical protein n=1 Tax=Sphingomonas sp. GCM10030256 TaxID=3273427 RepID=UPI003619999F
MIVFAGLALPGVFLALLLTWFLEARTTGFAAVVRLAFAGLAGIVVTCGVFLIVMASIVGWDLTSDPAVLVLPALFGAVSCVLFAVLGGGSREIAA